MEFLHVDKFCTHLFPSLPCHELISALMLPGCAGTSQSVLDSYQSNKLARFPNGPDPRNESSMGDDDDGDTQSSRTTSWAVKQEPPPKTGPQSWFPLSDVSPFGIPAAPPYQMSPRVISATPFAAPQPPDSTELQLSVKPAILEQAPGSAVSNVTWASFGGPPNLQTAAAFPLREPEHTSKALPSWLTSSKLGDVTASASLPGSGDATLPTTSLNNDPVMMPAHRRSLELWDKSEQEKVNTSPPLEQPCKLFGFNLAEKAVPAPVSSGPSHCDDSEESGPWPTTEHSSPTSVDQQLSKVATGSYQAATAPIRSGTKVRCISGLV